ncbi:TPA: heavy metal translocating P-type ATPase [Candidatus Dependentiae bacterium]|nr:MAG: Heavy metal translocating P-type ATPase [candidate division TM6 bacterium GW2011_GWE2_31_21]KKP53201.1 MAG: Heavy metal translocating P-type ATPase [candidate division TM6 bacterium GW2011_GWF2_33_332]HBS48019.1 heavy metal translocating P-type ATPase [Candidatus Dependentiae bacterium]HBZ73377.1 heavy metal translocating P-type ATPase [Candidatus Dependentiae bacterium]
MNTKCGHEMSHAAMKSNVHSMHSMHTSNMTSDFFKRFIVSIIFTIPILLFSPWFQQLLIFTIGVSFEIPYEEWILLFFATIVYFYGGYPFLKGLISEIRSKSIGMMTLVGIAISVSYIYSFFAVFGLTDQMFFEELSTLIVVMLLGHYIEMKIAMKSFVAVESLAKLLPSTAHLIVSGDKIEDIGIQKIKLGDKILIRPGEKVPADGIVFEGSSEVNESFLTGESKLVLKSIGDKVLAGAINENGFLKIEVQKEGKNSYLSQIIDLVNKTLTSKSKIQNLADKVAFILTILSLSFGLLAFLIWFVIQNNFSFALQRLVSVMVVSCPHALGLAIPLVISSIISIAALNGIFIKNKDAFEGAHKVNAIIFDKTGTLTYGRLSVVEAVNIWGDPDLSFIKYAAALEQNAKHGKALAILQKAENLNLVLPKVFEFKQIPGKGVIGKIEDKLFAIGNAKLMEEDFSFKNFEQDFIKAKQLSKEINEKGNSTVFIAREDKFLGLIIFEDVLREESFDVCEKLKNLKYQIYMVSGDSENVTKNLATKLGINYFAEILPDKKSEIIMQLQKEGKKVAMVGDGINDAPALAQADLGIAIGSGTEIAIESADLILVKNDLTKILEIFRLSKLTKKKLIQNLFWALGYNMVAMPIAAGVLYHFGIMINPSVSAIFMAVSVIIVSVNSKLIFK